MSLMLERPITDEEIKEAIELRFNDCFRAMNIANSFGGKETTAWKIVRTFSPLDLINEAYARHLKVEEFRGSVDKKPVTQSNLYRSCVLHSGFRESK